MADMNNDVDVDWRNNNHENNNLNNNDEADDDGNNNVNDNNNNNNVVDELEDEEDEDEEDDNMNDHGTTLDGGVALETNSKNNNGNRSSSDCDLILFIYCKDPLEMAPDHPIIRPGITVSIGLEKNTKLSAVFRRYVDFCNESCGEDEESHILLKDLEFLHCQLLNEHDTAETAALMKNDRILVRKEQRLEREAESERKRAQREADRVYFQQMRQLISGGGIKEADVILDCQGELVDSYGRNQRVLSSTIRAYTAIIARRCPWLANIIKQAREKACRESLNDKRKHDYSKETPDEQHTQQQLGSGATEIEDEEEEDNENYHDFSMDDDNDESHRNHDNARRRLRGGNNIDMLVVDDEDDDHDDERSLDSRASTEPARVEEETATIVPSSHKPRIAASQEDMLLVTIPNHSIEALKLLLEYCYTNRVIPLGRDAFIQSCKTKPTKQAGPVQPYHTSQHSKKWPNNGHPRVDFFVALAGIKIAEEAGMRRLSLMCEIAASQLVDVSNVTDALVMSSCQKATSGNDLPRLRNAAMNVILRRGARGVDDLSHSIPFKKALLEQKSVIIPTLLQGTMETLTHWDKITGIKRNTSEPSYAAFDELDKQDSMLREIERQKRRKGNGPDVPFQAEDFLMGNWEAEASLRSLKRMAAHRIDGVSLRRSRTRASAPSQRTSQRPSRRRRSRT